MGSKHWNNFIINNPDKFKGRDRIANLDELARGDLRRRLDDRLEEKRRRESDREVWE